MTGPVGARAGSGRRRSAELEHRIGAVVARQHGVVTHRQLLEAGVSRSGVVRRLRSGRLCVLHRGVYLAVPFLLPHAHGMAAVLASGPGAVLSHRSASALWGWRSAGLDVPADVTAAGKRIRRPGIRLHRVAHLEASDRTVKDGIPVTTPARTLADLAPVVGARELGQLVARAERENLVTREELAGLLERSQGRKGMRALRAVLEQPGGPALTRSEAETRFLALVRAARLPAPECNVRLGLYEVDFLWRRERLAVEVDGFRYHASRRSFEHDRRRDAELVAGGFTVLRLSWRQVTDEAMPTVAQLAGALGLSGARRTGE